MPIATASPSGPPLSIRDYAEKRGLLAQEESKRWPEGSQERDYRLGMAFAFQEIVTYIDSGESEP